MSNLVRGPGLLCEVHVDRGARIVSLRGDDGYEWLAPSKRTASPGRGQSFVREGMGGWDEVAPTVQTDVGMTDTAGTALADLPDHGDIWNVPWKLDSATPTVLATSVQLLSMRILLERTIAASATGLSISYRASTTAAGQLPLLWCAHPQFAAGGGATVALESAGAPITPQLIEMHPLAGRRLPFPDGSLHHDLAPASSVKAFVAPAVRADAAVLHVGLCRALRLAWDAEQLPYLGLFWDNGEFATEPVLAIEPSTAWGERLSAAVALLRVPTVSRGRPLEWALHLSAESGGTR
jgi:hypothetical protein